PPSNAPTMPSCLPPPSATAWCAARRAAICAPIFTGPWRRDCRRSIASCSAASTKASGRPRPAAIRGCRGRCAARSASTCPSVASACPRTISPNAWGPRKSFCRAPPRSPARRRWPLASCNALPRLPASAGAPRSPAAIITCTAPSPPPDLRPARLSVTEIVNWLRDPYTIYAKHVLELHPFENIDTPPGVADRGSAIHDAIGDFTKAFAAGLPADPVKELIAFGEAKFAPLADFPEARAFWWPRFLRIAQWFAAFERARRASIAELHAEIRGELPIALGATTFTLSGRADRIERRNDGRFAIL